MNRHANRPAMAMVITFCETQEHGPDAPQWLAKRADSGGEYTFWNTELKAGEAAEDAAVRAMKTFFSQPKEGFRPHMLMATGKLDTEWGTLHIFCMTSYLSTAMLLDEKNGACIPLAKIGDYVDKLTLNATTVVEQIPIERIESMMLPL